MKKLTFKPYLLLLAIIIGNFDALFQVAHTEQLNYKKFNSIKKNIDQLHNISNAHSECLIQIQQQLSENQQNINTLRGHIQNIQHEILSINNNQTELYKKLDEVFNYQKKIHTTHDIHQLPNTPRSEFKIPTTNTTNVNSVSVTKDTHDRVYKQAVSLVLEKKQYDQAIQKFQIFIKDYPNSSYQANAHYWLGQLYYNKNDKEKASYYFALVTKNYPTSLKAPEALLKIGIIMQEANKKDKAKIIYQQINKLYPNSNAAKQAKKHLIHL